MKYSRVLSCLSEKLIEVSWLLSVTHSGTDDHREHLCLADHKNVRQSPIMAGNQGEGLPMEEGGQLEY